MKKDLVFESRIENLRLVEQLVDEISSNYNLSSELYGNVLIACIEAANNAISHGNQLDPSKQVVIQVYMDDKVLNVKTIDQGQGFDYANIPDPTAPENIEKVSGRGVFLMKQLSDGLEFEDQGRISILTFNL